MSQRANIDTQELVEEIKRGLPSAPIQFSQEHFNRFCENIANAIVSAIDRYDGRMKSPEADFGEEERVV